MRCVKERWNPESRYSLARWRRVATHHQERPGGASRRAPPSTAAEKARETIASSVSSRAYCDNKVVTSRYTLLTFVPMNLFEQLQRPLNFYFLMISVLLCIPEFAPVSPLTLLIPLGLAFALSGMKEAIDDKRRHDGDRRMNNRLYRVYNPTSRGFEVVESWRLRVGDVVVLFEGDEVPCDVVPLCSAAGAEGTTFCCTANLDGEADSKTKHCALSGPIARRFPPTSPLDDSDARRSSAAMSPTSINADGGVEDEDENAASMEDDLTAVDRLRRQLSRLPPLEKAGPLDLSRAPDLLEAIEQLEDVLRCTVIDVEPPSRVLTTFTGTAIVFDRPIAEIDVHPSHDIHSLKAPTAADGVPIGASGPKVQHRIALSPAELLVSTSVMATTPFTIGAVVYTGNEAKIHRCRRPVPVKWSVIDRLTNRFAVSVFAIQLSLVVTLAILSKIEFGEHRGRAWYLELHDTPNIQHYLYVPVTFFLLFSMMVPLSVKVTLELSKFYISELIEWDIDLYDEETDTAASVNSRALTEELGLVQFVMADKTGTLTENSMSLRRLAFAVAAPSRVPHNPSTDSRDVLAASAVQLQDAAGSPLPAAAGGEGMTPAASTASFAPEVPKGTRVRVYKVADSVTKGARLVDQSGSYIDVSMPDLTLPSAAAAGHARRTSGDPNATTTATAAAGNQWLDRRSAAALFAADPAARELAYAIAVNNSCEVAHEPVSDGRMSRQNSKNSYTPFNSRPATPPTAAAMPGVDLLPPLFGDDRGHSFVSARTYASTSPDEVALVQTFDRGLSCSLTRRTKRTLTVRLPRLTASAAGGRASMGLSAAGNTAHAAAVAAGARRANEQFETDPRVDHQSVREASYVNIPVIAFTNSDSPLRGVDVAIPCNNRNKTSLALMWWMLTREVLRLRGTIPRSQPWDVMVDMFIYRDPEEEREQERLAAEEKKREAAHEAAEAFDQQEEWPETAAFVPTENWGDAPAGATAAAAGGWSQSWDQAAPK